jgi:PTH1 family peptidyl-tRNA hydrolase
MATDLIVCGLGNPGPQYRDTRHNLGFWVADLLGERFAGRWRRPCDSYLECDVSVGGASLLLVKPLTYMNLTGKAVRKLASARHFDPAALLAVCDDTALPLGLLRLRAKGSDGGHNGLRSVIEALGTSEFPRLRLGVGPVPEIVDQAEFVLAGFETSEVKPARSMVSRAADCVEWWAREGIDKAMSRFNTRDTGEPAPPDEPKGD